MGDLTADEVCTGGDEEVVVSLPETALDDLEGLEASWQDASEESASTSEAPTHERRETPRHTPEDVKGDLRLAVAGFPMRLVNLSATGLLAETNQRLCPGRTVDVFLRYGGTRQVLKASVIRSTMHALTPEAIFRTALQFEGKLSLRDAGL